MGLEGRAFAFPGLVFEKAAISFCVWQGYPLFVCLRVTVDLSLTLVADRVALHLWTAKVPGERGDEDDAAGEGAMVEGFGTHCLHLGVG